MITATSTKKEIIEKIIKIGEWMDNAKIAHPTRSFNSWNLEKREVLVDILNKMISTIMAEHWRDAKKNPDNYPELRELVSDYNAEMVELDSLCCAHFETFENSVKAMIRGWLGEDIKVHASNYQVELGVPMTNKPDRCLDITIYYRDKMDYTNLKPLKGGVEVNFPCFGSFDPTHPDNSDIRRWTQVLATVTNSVKELEAIRALFDLFYEERYETSKKNHEIEKTYKEKAFAITLPILNDIFGL